MLNQHQTLLCSALFFVQLSFGVVGDWPQWRGPKGDGRCDEKGLPTRWSATENVVWKVALPEPGNSTPVVWGNRVFVTQPIFGNATWAYKSTSDYQASHMRGGQLLTQPV